MTDHKFTDEEVIKALECCSQWSECEKCPYKDVTPDCVKSSTTDAVSLINRQKAEIEELNTNLALAFDNAKNNTIERIREHTIRFVAINEFAERLKAGLIEGGIYPVLVKNTINKVLKEMTEDK